MDIFDITKLPDKYTFNQESLSEEKYIDDNSLFVYFCISQGLFSGNNDSDSQAGFLFFHPFEWTSIDFIAFLLSVSESYGLIIENIKTIIPAIEDEYEVSFEPKEYMGAYKWILELKEKEPNREEVALFNKFFTDTASVSDIERALIYANRIVPFKDKKNEFGLSKEIFGKIIAYTSFSITLNSFQKNKLKNDLNSYLEAFIQEKLIKNRKSKRIGNTFVEQSENIFTFKKHSLLFKEYLQKMQNDFGNFITIENTFEERFPNLKYPEAEIIRKRYTGRNFLFLHILLAFKKQGFIKISLLCSNWDYHEDEMLTYKAKIEILPAFFSENQSKKISFDEDKGFLILNDSVIKFRKFTEQYHTLRIIFNNKNLEKEWMFSEIAEQMDFAKKYTDKDFHNYFSAIKRRVSAETGLKDLFLTTNQSVKINKDYL